MALQVGIMIHKDMIELAERFHNLQLHAARGGREAYDVLVKVLEESQEKTIRGLLQELYDNVSFLLPLLPPYAPPLQSINHILLVLESAQTSSISALEVKHQLKALHNDICNPHANHLKMAQYLSNLLPENSRVYTHTLSETVLGVLSELQQSGKVGSVIVTESRPNNDGWETARRLAERGLKVQLAIDAAMPEAIQASDLMISGAEIVNPDGSVLGKVGAHIAAIFCQLYERPLYITADSGKINHIPWKHFCLNKISANDMGIDFSHPSFDVIGTYFDMTPPHLIRSYVTEMGVMKADEIQSVLSDREISVWLIEHMSD